MYEYFYKNKTVFHFHLLPELSISQQLLHHCSLPVLLGDPGVVEVHWVVHHSPNLCHIHL